MPRPLSKGGESSTCCSNGTGFQGLRREIGTLPSRRLTGIELTLSLPEKKRIEELGPALSSISALLADLSSPGALVGWGAVALRAYARVTSDLDTIILDESPDYDAFATIAARHGIYPAEEDSLANARRSRIFRMVHRKSGVPADFLFGMFRHEVNAVRRASIVTIYETAIAVTTPEDLIVLKSLARRDIDLIDIAAIFKSVEVLDLKFITREVKWLSREVEEPEVWAVVEPYIIRRNRES